MTIASRHLAAVTRPLRGRLARSGVAGGLVLWCATLAGVPFYLISALLAGLALSLVDGVRRRFARWRGAARSLANGAEVWSGLLVRIISTADTALRPFIRRQADQVVISLPRARAFSSDEATPSIGARHLLERLAAALDAGAWRIDVIGYDDGPQTGARSDDRAAPASLSLSARRARAVLQALRGAGCRQPIATLGAPLPREAAAASPSSPGPPEPAGIDIVIRKAAQGVEHAA
jgi:hypothetical protein